MTEVHLDKEKQENQEGQKTIVAFVVGLLIGGLLVWVFSGSEAQTPADTMNDGEPASETSMNTEVVDTETNTSSNTTTNAEEPAAVSMTVGEGKVQVSDQPAGSVVSLDGATFPTETGWIGVRTYTNDQLGSVLGAALYSQEDGLVPEEIHLLSPTVAGRDYAVVFYTEDGDRMFTLANDVQIDTAISTFTAR